MENIQYGNANYPSVVVKLYNYDISFFYISNND